MNIIMNKGIFLKRILLHRMFYIAIFATLTLLLCSIVHTDFFTGEEYTFLSLFYNNAAKEALKSGGIQMENVLLGYDTGYLWMFCPVIAGIPCVITKKTERFPLFRWNKNKYFLLKYFSNLVAGGMILLLAYTIYATLGMLLVRENLWNINLMKKLLSMFFWGMYSAIPSVILEEFVRNQYLILCVPVVLNYFAYTFLSDFLPRFVGEYVLPHGYQILCLYPGKKVALFFGTLGLFIIGCAMMKKAVMERRLDCGR